MRRGRRLCLPEAARICHPCAVNAEKQKHLIAAAKAYLRRFPQTSRIRFDVIEVYGKITKKRFFCKERERFSVQKINHIENAFMQTTTL